MNDIIKIIISLEDFSALIDGVTETVKHGIKKKIMWISSCFASTFSCFNSATSNIFSNKKYKYKWKSGTSISGKV